MKALLLILAALVVTILFTRKRKVKTLRLENHNAD